MEQLDKLIFHYLNQHDATNAFHAATGGSRAGTNEHTYREHDPSHVRPFRSVVVEETRCRDEGYHLEYGRAESMTETVIVVVDEFESDEQRETHHEEKVKAELTVAEEFVNLEFGQAEIEQWEVYTGEEAEQCSHIVEGGRIEMLC